MKNRRLASFSLRAAIASFACAVVVACSSSSPQSTTPSDASSSAPVAGSATVTGTMSGHSFTNANAIALKGVYDSAYPGIVEIFINDDAQACAHYQAAAAQDADLANDFRFALTLGQTIASSQVVPGVYSASSANEIDDINWYASDGQCIQSEGSGFSTATVTITSVDPYVGTFDVTFVNGDHVTGNFNAPLCSLAIGTNENPDGGIGCIQ